MDGKAERRWLGTFPCDNERTIALSKIALRAYEGKSSKLIPTDPRSRVGTQPSDKYFTTPLASARSSAYVTESASLPIPVYLVLDLFHL